MLHATKSDSAQYAVEKVLKEADPTPESRALVERAIKSLTRVLHDIMDTLPAIQGIKSAEGSEIIALIAGEALKHDPLTSKRALLKLRGQVAFRQQVEDSGGVYTTQQVAQLLDTTPGAVRKRLERGRLLGIPFGENTSFPVWQFDDNGIVKHFADIMKLVNTSSSLGKFYFFLTYDEDLGQTSIDALKDNDLKKFEIVKILATQFNQQIAR
ncbi:MAG: hypothetical protein COB30_002735 [Ectothiorhodospiraceae bacterium]|nr:hypothetical protein [Ectothiorhodospiraceae bacterium]